MHAVLCQEVAEVVPAPGRGEIVRATSAEAAGALRRAWLELRARQPAPTADADPDFFLGVYGALGTDVAPWIVLVGQPGQPRCMIIGRRHRQRGGAGRLASWPLNRLDIVYGGLMTDGSSAAQEVLIELLQEALDCGSFDLISIHHLDQRDELTQRIEAALKPGAHLMREPHLHFRVQLVEEATGQLVQRNSGKTRSTFRRKDKKLIEHFGGSVEMVTFTSAADVLAFIAQAAGITSQTYQAALQTGVQDAEPWRTIVSTLANDQRLRGYVLQAQGHPIAYVLGSLLDGRFTLMATGYLPNHGHLSPGLVLIVRVLEALAAEGVLSADLGFGDAEYKRMLATQCDHEVTLTFHGRSFRAQAAYWSARCLQAIRGGALRAAAIMRVAEPLKRWHRRRLALKSAGANV